METVGHILWAYMSAKDVWMECSPKVHKCTSDEIDFVHIMEKLMERLDPDQMQLTVTVARQIWMRNSMVFSSDMLAPAELVRHARDRVEVVCHAAVTSSPTVAVSRPIAGWLPPPVGYVKVNWDASISKQQNKMGAGIAVRNHTGQVLVMACATKTSLMILPWRKRLGRG
jgi:hypothetical protein